MEREVYAILDIGGTKLLLALLESGGQVVFKEKYPTISPSGREGLTNRINRLIGESLNMTGSKLKGLAISVPGPVDFNSGKVINTPNLSWEDEMPVAEIMSREWSVPVIVENDANAAVLGEALFGAARGKSNVIYVTVSTGIGAGFYLQGEIYRGARGFAAEVGHTKNFGSRVCNCGGKGCLESEASGESISQKGQEVLKADEGNRIETADVFKRARQNDPPAVKLIDEVAEHLGRAFANLATLLDPDAIVVGGGVSAEGESFLTKVKTRMEKHAYYPVVGRVALVKALLEPESPLWGMYYLINRLDKNGGRQ